MFFRCWANKGIRHFIGFIALIGIEFPVAKLAETYGVDMCIVGDNALAVSHVTQYVSHRVDLNFVEANLLHLFFYAMNNPALCAALSGNADQVPQKFCHCGQVAFCGFIDAIVIHNTP